MEENNQHQPFSYRHLALDMPIKNVAELEMFVNPPSSLGQMYNSTI